MATTHVPLHILEDNTEQDLRNTHTNNTGGLRGALDNHTSSQHPSPTRTDPPQSIKAGYIYNMFNQQPREDEHISDISSDDTPPDERDTPTT